MASKYRQRDESLYTEPPINEEYANNPHIMPWWTDTHDLVILASSLSERTKQWCA